MQSSPFLVGNTNYSEIFTLPAGCYSLKFNDLGDDGLYFWNLPSNGSGFARIRFNGSITKIFNPDFGRFFQYDFYTDGSTVSNTPALSAQRLIAYPNPSNGDFQVFLEGAGQEMVQMAVYDVSGRKVWGIETLAASDGTIHLPIDLKNQAAGAYWLRVNSGGQLFTKELIKQ